MMKKFRNDVNVFTKKIILNKSYYIPLILFCLCAYGFNLVNRTVGVDDLAYKVFGGDIHYAFTQFRWGIYLLEPIIGVDNYTPFIGRFFALLLLVLAGMMLCFIFFFFDKKDNLNIWKYSIFSSIFCTYPLINEVWEFNWLSLPINYDGISFFMCLACISVIYQLYNSINLKRILVSGLPLIPVMAGYESVVFFYISLVFIILFLKNRDNNKNNWFLDGLGFAFPLVIGLIGRYVVGYALIYTYGLQDNIADSAGRVYWMEDPVEAIKGIINNGWYYIIRGLTYFPITEFVISLIIFVVYVVYQRINHKKNYILLGLFLVISLFFLSFIQGDYLTYRTAQTVQLFVAFVYFLVLDFLEGKKLFTIITIILFCVCLKQSVNLHTLLALNNQRSENEAFIARNIGYRLYSEFDTKKTVIFCGEYQLGSFIEDQITIDGNSLAGKFESKIRDVIGHHSNRYYDEYVSTNINSFWNYQMDAFFGQVMLKNYLSYYGFDINVLENLSREEENKLKGYYELIAKEENMKSFDIKDMGDYILVYLGPTIDRVSKLEYK